TDKRLSASTGRYDPFRSSAMEGPDQNVADALSSDHVGMDHRSRIPRVEERALGSGYRERTQCSGVRAASRIDDCLDDIGEAGAQRRRSAVERRADLSGGAGEIGG